MGSADVVPGVSGGTVALIVGIYERLIASVRSAAEAAVALLRFDVTGFRSGLAAVHWGLIVPLFAGIALALVTGAKIIPPLLDDYPQETSALFFGLILASLIVPWQRISSFGGREIALAVVAAVAAFVLAGLPDSEITDPPLYAVFPAAMIAICAMILPGVSGSFLLLVMGLYEPTLEALDERNLVYVAVFMMGAAVGIGAFSRLLGWLLDHRHDLTMAALLGLMLGSLRALWPYADEGRGLEAPPAELEALGVLGFVLLGIAVVTTLLVVGATFGQRDPLVEQGVEAREDADGRPTTEPEPTASRGS